MLYNFLSATYNLISGTNPHEEDYRLTVDWHSCGFFYSKTKNKEALLCKRNRQFNTALWLMPKCTFRSVMKKNQRPFSRQKSGVLYEKLFAISTAISGRNFGSKRETKREQFGQSVAHYTSKWKFVGSAESFCSLKITVAYTLYYHFAQHH